jgi:AraC-like DNA-binding protein
MGKMAKNLSDILITMQTIRYLFTKPPVETEALTVRGLGIREVMRPGIVDRPTLGDYLCMFFYDEALIGAEDGVQRHPPQRLIIWHPDHDHCYGNPDAVWMHSWMHCHGTVVGELLKAAGLPYNQVLPLPDAELIERYLLAFDHELTQQARPQLRILANLLDNWIIEIARAAQADGQVIPQNLLEIKRFIEHRYASPLTLQELAARANLSVSHFCSEFKRYFGVTAVEYLIRLRMQHASYLLRDRNVRVSEVAHLVGYEDLYHFSRLFKKRYGASPRHLRRQWQDVDDGAA